MFTCAGVKSCCSADEVEGDASVMCSYSEVLTLESEYVGILNITGEELYLNIRTFSSRP